MGGGNPIDQIEHGVSDVFNDPLNAVNNLTSSIDDLKSDAWKAGWVKIPGTNWQFNLWGIAATGLSGLAFVFFPGNPFYRKQSGGDNFTSIGENPYRVKLKYYINDIVQDKILFSTAPPENSIQEMKNYFKYNPTYSAEDICVDVRNSSLRLVFDDTYFNDNDGIINVSICYLGATEDCNCNILSSPTDIAVGFTRIDNTLTYPVVAHGMKYVGDNTGGISTGGRCEENNISEVEIRLKNKYKSHYTVDFDDTLEKEDLQKDRVLDLAYEYNGNTWIRRQNLIESVYYHTGVGNQTNAIFFGGIHDTMADYTFSYNNELNSLPTAIFEEWDCANKSNIEYVTDSLYGVNYPNDLTSSACWSTPSWQLSGAYTLDCSTIQGTGSCLIFNDPSYSPNSTTSLSYITDPDYPKIEILNISDAGVYKFDSCISTNIKVNFPSTFSLQVTANEMTGNTFSVDARSANISGFDIGTFKGYINVDEINFDFKNKFYIFPTDISGAYYNEKKNVFIKEINTNQDTVNILGYFQYGFQYMATDPISGGISEQTHIIYGAWVLYFTSLNDIYDSIINDTKLTAMQSYIAIDATTFAVSGGVFFGTGYGKFSIDKKTGISVGVEDADYTWKSTNETCGQDIASVLNIEATIGTDSELRWGVPLWNSTLAQNANFTADLLFNSSKETADGNIGDILHEITNITINSNSIMALANKRILIEGETKKQDHLYKALNDVEIKMIGNVISTNYIKTNIGSQYPQSYNFNIVSTSACAFDFIENISKNYVTGTVTSNGAVCCAGTHSFPSSAFINPTTISISGGMSKISWDYVDGCVWDVQDVQVTVISGNVTSKVGFEATNTPLYSCPSTIIDSTITGTIQVSGVGISGTTFIFPSSNYVYSSVSEWTPSINNDYYTAIVTHTIKDNASHTIGYLLSTIKSVSSGTLTVSISSCLIECQKTITNVLASNLYAPSSGNSYSEYATSFVQEYRSDGKNKVVENWIPSNDDKVIPVNNGIIKSSNWKRWMDGVGLGGDAPDYDTIYNVKAKTTYPTINWKEIGYWNVGQMAFGTPTNAVIVGGHKIDRSVGRTIKGSGLHASPTSTRVFVWDQTKPAPEDSYLKNYYTRRFNTYTPNGTIPISSNQNLSDLNCIIYEAESDILIERIGTVKFDGSSNIVQVVFEKEMDASVGVNYSVSITCGDNVKMWWENKTTTGFEIHSEIDTWVGSVDWLATAVIKTTEDDITNVGNSSGYNFEK